MLTTKLNTSEKDEIIITIKLAGETRVLRKSFFISNLGRYRDCDVCGKQHLDRYERVDCEGLGGVLTYCLECWIDPDWKLKKEIEEFFK